MHLTLSNQRPALVEQYLPLQAAQHDLKNALGNTRHEEPCLHDPDSVRIYCSHGLVHSGAHRLQIVSLEDGWTDLVPLICCVVAWFALACAPVAEDLYLCLHKLSCENFEERIFRIEQAARVESIPSLARGERDIGINAAKLTRNVPAEGL